jgi:hypothetical protein
VTAPPFFCAVSNCSFNNTFNCFTEKKIAMNKTKLEWMRTRFQIEQKRIEKALKNLESYSDKTPEEAEKMFEREPAVTLYRRNGWLNEDERWKIAFYAQKLPRRTRRRDCAVHMYEIAAKFAVSLPTVYVYAHYEG